MDDIRAVKTVWLKNPPLDYIEIDGHPCDIISVFGGRIKTKDGLTRYTVVAKPWHPENINIDYLNNREE